MGKIDFKKKSDNTAAKSFQRTQYLKIGIAVLITVGICGWVTYSLLNPGTTVRYNDFAIDSAVTWLENADRGKFDVCRKNIVNNNGWFGLFIPDRQSLDKVKARSLHFRRKLPRTTKGMKRYELKFNSKFSKIVHPKSEVTERMIIETDGGKQFKVLIADYWMSRAFVPSDLSLTENDKQQIMNIAGRILKKVEARDIEFFKRSCAELAKLPDYFGWSKYFKNPKWTIMLFKILEKGNPSPFKFTELKSFAPAGRTGFECSGVRYRFSAEDKGEKANFKLSIFVDRDLYQNKSAKWKFHGIGWNKEKKK